ncbi:MAG: DUF2202 domain-containing protein [Terracoccus sp.]
MNTNQIRAHVTTRRSIAAVLAGLTLTGTMGIAMAQNGAAAPLTGATVVAAQTTSDAATLAFNREEERMARDLYQSLADTYDGAAPFAMITQSEQTHWTRIGDLLTAHGITDPSAGLAAGTYADPAIQSLYDGWLARGLTSLDEAYQVGIELEQRDIADLTTAITSTTLADARRVLTALRAASEHHLAAFEAAASGQTLGAGRTGATGAQDGMRQGAGRQGRSVTPATGSAGAGMQRGTGAGGGDGTCRIR